MFGFSLEHSITSFPLGSRKERGDDHHPFALFERSRRTTFGLLWRTGDRRQLANWARYFSASLPVVLHVSAITPRAFTATAAAQGVVTAAAAVRASAS